MSETAPVPTLDDSVAENYRQLQAETGRSWTDMAEQFDRDAAALPAEHAAPYRSLATWARAQEPEPEPEPEIVITAPRQSGKRTTTESKPTRTA